jgi:hypothetical protein
MAKQASVITVTKMANGMYSVDARGAFGGGWTKPTPGAELTSTIIRAWQMYGSNPLGCEIIGELPPAAQEIADKLMTAADDKKTVLTIRVLEQEANIIRQAAESANESVNEWVRQALIQAATK